MLLALFAVAPIICSCLFSLMYSIYLFMAYEEMGVHHAQEFENRFWTIFALLLSTALFFAKDSPIAFGLWSPSLGFLCVLLSGYAMHIWDRHLHRIATSQPVGGHLRRTGPTSQSLLRLQDLGIPVSAQLEKIKECLTEIDQLLIPSTINNYINQRFVLSKEREIIKIIEDCDARALNYLISHVKLGLLFYKIKDHHNFNGKNRTELINLLAIERLQILTVISRVILLHSLQLLKLRANPRAEYWVQNILLHTHQDDLSELKTLTDAKGDYFSMNKLIYDDIRSESVRQTILSHIRREAAVQETYMLMGTRRKNRVPMQRRKVLSDVDDTLLSSGGMYPAGVDKRYAKKTVYPGVLAFYRELDLGTEGPDEWEDDQVGNLVFLSARPHFYRDMSEKHNFAKFEMLRANTLDGRKGLHTTPSLLAGDLSSGSQYMMRNDFEPLAKKKFDNFRRYVSIYPEYKHVFVCDNGQGDVRAAEIMFDNFPYEFEGVYVHVVQDLQRTYGYEPCRWRQKEFAPYFFRCYPEAALHAASRSPPLIRVKGLQRICHDAGNDFLQIKKTQFASELAREERRLELNQAIWRANEFLVWHSEQPVNMILAEQRWKQGEKVRTPYGIAIIRNFDPVYNLYDVDLDWRPLDIQVLEYLEEQRKAPTVVQPRRHSNPQQRALHGLATVTEIEDEEFTIALGRDEERDSDLLGTDVAEFAVAVNGGKAEDIVMGLDELGCANVGEQEVGESSAESSNRPYPRRAASLDDSAETTATAVKSLVMDTIRQSVSDNVGSEKEMSAGKSGVRAQVSGRIISKYYIPSLPVFESKKKATSIFPFLSKTSESKAVESKVLENKIQLFKKGEEVITPFGPATVVEHREKQCIVVVDTVGWIGIGYLQQSTLKRMPISLFGSLLRQLSGVEGSQKGLDFPYARGTLIATPFGQGKVERPIKLSKSSRTPPSATIGLSLESWKLANGTRPMLYCAVETAQAWKDKKPQDGSSLLSTLNTIVSSSRSLLVPFLSHKKLPIEERKVFKKYFKEAAAVCTKYGDGRVDHFRETDGFYQVSLVQWTLSDGTHPKAFIRNDEITYRLSKGCQESHPVLTSLGLSGKLASVEPTSGVHIVTIPSAGMVCYLQPESVRPLKAAAGEEVLTQYGEGRVTGYNPATDVYSIELSWNAKLYARCDTFDRVGDGVPDSEGRFGVDWLLRFLFFRSETRSRSNSVVSGTPSNRSGT